VSSADCLSPNWNERPGPVDALVLHYTGMLSGRDAVERLCDPAAQVSSHYVLHEDGELTCLVSEDKRAWHAGVSGWQGYSGLNDGSIGIEIVNGGHAHGMRPYPDRQMSVLTGLCLDIIKRYAINPTRIVGHSDIAPERKLDPGEHFDWRGLAAAGVGLWPDRVSAAVPDGVVAEELMTWIGYPPARSPERLAAFQRRFRPWRVDGRLDHETMGRLVAVNGLYRQMQSST
jgi:N-acetylmuramoyl-L-alanine amidase